jgi:hypothetical protein
MEPANMNPHPDRADAHLEALLREPAPAVPDDGFSARVLTALPPPVGTPLPWTRVAICTGLAVTLTMVALILAGPVDAWAASWSLVESALAPVAAQLLDPKVLIALAVATASVSYAFWSSSGRTRRMG